MFEEILDFLQRELNNLKEDQFKYNDEAERAYNCGKVDEIKKIKGIIEHIIKKNKEELSSQVSDLYQPLTLTEAILHAESVAYNYEGNYSDMCANCRKQHEQLANWLKELREFHRIYINEPLKQNKNKI